MMMIMMKVISSEPDQGRNVLEKLSYRLQQGRHKSRDLPGVTSRENDVIKPALRHGDSSAPGNYPLLVLSVCILFASHYIGQIFCLRFLLAYCNILLHIKIGCSYDLRQDDTTDIAGSEN